MHMHMCMHMRAQAHIFVVPTFGSLSEAVAGCEATTHLQRQEAAATALKASPWFARYPPRPVLYMHM